MFVVVFGVLGAEAEAQDAGTQAAPTAEEDAAPAEAEKSNGISTTFTNDFEFRYQEWDIGRLIQRGGPAPRFIEQVNRFTARANLKRWSFNVQVDEVLFIGTPYLLDGQRTTAPPPLITDCASPPCVRTPYPDNFYANPEKVALAYTGDDVEVTLGDFYTVFGYGAALNLNRNVDIDIDTSIQGASVIATPGDWEITGVAGMLNRQQVFADFINVGRLQGDLRHLVAGARAVRHGLGPATVGAHAVAYDFANQIGFEGAREQAGTSLDAVIGGATLDLYGFANADWRFEADVVGFPLDELDQNVLFPSSQPAMGHSLYGAAQFFLGSTVWQVEAKRYKDFQRVNGVTGGVEFYQVLTPPTLEYERAVNPDSQAALISNDISGGRVQMDIMAGRTTPYLALGFFRDNDLLNAAQKAPAPETIGVVGAGVEALLDDFTVLTNVQGRYENRDGAENGRDAQLYGDFDLKFPLVGEAHGDLIIFGQRFWGGRYAGEDLDSTHDFTEASVSLTIAPNHWMGVTGFFDYTTNPVAQMGGNLGPTNFGAVEAYFKPSTAWTVRAFYGGYAAGIRCSGGQCRLVPAFTGARLAVTGTF